MRHAKIYFQFLLIILSLSISSCKTVPDESKVDPKAPDYHNIITAHYHSPCAKVAETKTTTTSTSVSNISVKVLESSYLNGQNVKLIITPPDCRTGGVVVEPKGIYKTRVVGFTMLQQDANGKWITTPTEYVAYSPRKL